MNTNSCVVSDTATIQCLVPLFEGIVKAVITLGAIGLFVMLLAGGFTFLFSGGDPKKLEAARGTVTQAIMGIAIMSIAYLIILTIEQFTGVNVTEFSIPTQ